MRTAILFAQLFILQTKLRCACPAVVEFSFSSTSHSKGPSFALRITVFLNQMKRQQQLQTRWTATAAHTDQSPSVLAQQVLYDTTEASFPSLQHFPLVGKLGHWTCGCFVPLVAQNPTVLALAGRT
jgi:hypothetical protein